MAGLYSFARTELLVFAEDAQDSALDGDLRRRNEDGLHFSVCGLQTHHVSLRVKTLQRGFGTMDEGHDDLALACGSGALNQNIIAIDDVLIAHGIAADFKGEDIFVSNYVAQGDGLEVFSCLDGEPGCDPAGQRQAIA